jgi:hypothetical protein
MIAFAASRLKAIKEEKGDWEKVEKEMEEYWESLNQEE